LNGSGVSVRLRPYLVDSLEKLAEMYEIVVFTAGEQEYADNILDYIDPEKRLFKKKLYRQDCIKIDNFFIKDLDIILDRDRENMVIVDNSILSFAFDLDNGVPINSFMGTEDDDKELLFLYSFLEEAVNAPDIREKCKESFKLSYLQSSILNVK
jgi:CTD small phosphatase-like protein 2